MTTWGTAGLRLGPSSTASYGYILGAQATAAEWVRINPVVPFAAFGGESDTGRAKVGDGVSDWNTLPYVFYPLNSVQRTTTGVDTTDDIIVDNSATGLVLKDSNGDYWRVYVDPVGPTLSIQSLGATKP
jgi:hypothetical protein